MTTRYIITTVTEKGTNYAKRVCRKEAESLVERSNRTGLCPFSAFRITKPTVLTVIKG